jgi:hypothetical protein
LGELQTSIMLKSVPNGTRAAEGWDGDRYEVFARDDEKLGLVSVSIWDSEADAQEFAEAFKKYRGSSKHLAIRPKRGAATKKPLANTEANAATEASPASEAEPQQPDPQDSAQQSLVFSAESVHEALLDGTQVWILDGFSAEENELIKVALKNCTFAEKTFPMPQK